jgi:pimeloyl-ACP methyl ester carboxylesterase
VTTGEDHLDRIVPPALTRQYLSHLPRARYVVLPRTGHSGLVMKPFEFAALVHRFCDEIAPDVERVPA